MYVKWIVLALIVTLIPSSGGEPLHPLQNYRHWQVLAKVCETGRKTYGANEFVQNGQVCRWTMVPYWPADRAAWEAARAIERRAEK